MLAIDLEGRVALVLGGSRGIGAGIVRALCQAGCSVFFTHTGNPRYKISVETLIEEIRKESWKAKDFVLDALDFEATKKLVESIVQDQGKIDILVCNVGKNLPRPVEEMEDKDWHTFIDINLTSAYYGVRAVLPHMVKRRYGRIILIGSSAVYDGGGGAIDYAAAKAGMIGMMKYLCRTYTRMGINTNIIHPCVIETDLLKERYSTEEAKNKLVSQIPAGRLGKPEDVAGMVAYLASSWGDYITGQEILLDGGRTIFR